MREATGPYWVGLALTLSHSDYAVSIAKAVQVHYFARAQLKRAKSDQLDALTIAEFAQTKAMRGGCGLPTAVLPRVTSDNSRRESLLKFQTQLQNQLEALTANPIVIESVQTQLEELVRTLTAQIKQMDKELKELIKAELSDFEEFAEELLTPEQLWKRNIALLRTIPGIGVMTECWLVLATKSFTNCESAKALVHYAGLAPTCRTSGTSMRDRPSVGHSGHARLRTRLFMATLTAARYNSAIAAFYRRLRGL